MSAETGATRVVVGTEEEGRRLDVFIAGCPGVLSRSAAQRMITDGRVRVDGEILGKNHRLCSGQTVAFTPQEIAVVKAEAEDISLTIVHEDSDIIVIDKEAGMVVHPGAGNHSGTLVNALLDHTVLADIGAPLRPGIVHRLDKETSGLIVVAKTDRSYLSIVEQIKAREVKREYLAVVEGSFSTTRGEIDAPIGRSSKDRKMMQVGTGQARPAQTSFRVVKTTGEFSLLRVTLKTGRTHQIRVHMRYIDHPIIGDRAYGSGRYDRIGGLRRQWLHATTLSFVHPETRARVEFESDPPAELRIVLDDLELSS